MAAENRIVLLLKISELAGVSWYFLVHRASFPCSHAISMRKKLLSISFYFNKKVILLLLGLWKKQLSCLKLWLFSCILTPLLRCWVGTLVPWVTPAACSPHLPSPTWSAETLRSPINTCPPFSIVTATFFSTVESTPPPRLVSLHPSNHIC